MFSAVRPLFSRNINFPANWNCKDDSPPPPPPSLSELSFVLIQNNFRMVTVKFEMAFYFGILSSFYFFPIARNVLNVKTKVSDFFATLLVD